jgi:hypothetical protein
LVYSIPCAFAGGDGVKIGLPALDVARAFPQATPASLFPPALLTPACCSVPLSVQVHSNSIRWNWERKKKKKKIWVCCYGYFS